MRRQPRFTRSATLFPYTALFRSLAARAALEVGEHEHPARLLVARELRADVRDELRLGDRGRVVDGDPGRDDLAPARIRDAVDDGVVHERVPHERLLEDRKSTRLNSSH